MIALLRADFWNRGVTFYAVIWAGLFGPSLVAQWMGVLR